MERDKKKEEKEWEIIFAHFPKLKRAFDFYDKRIRFYNHYEWEEGATKERLIQKRDILLSLAKNLTSQDLLLLYYIKSVRGISEWTLLRALEKLYQTEGDVQKALRQESSTYDVMKIVPCGYKGGRSVKKK